MKSHVESHVERSCGVSCEESYGESCGHVSGDRNTQTRDQHTQCHGIIFHNSEYIVQE